MNEIKPLPAVADILSPDAFEAAIRAVGAERYHDKHPFHKLLHGGKLNKGQVQAWALNRYCYQEAVPRKDAAFISRVHDRELRREWIHRILDHDGLGRGTRRHRALAEADRRARPADRDYVMSRAARCRRRNSRSRPMCASSSSSRWSSRSPPR